MLKKALFLILFLILLAIAPTDTFALGNPVKISTSSNDAIFPATVTDSKGYLHIVWQELTPGQSWSGINPGIYYSRWNGDTWSTPLKLSENTEFAENPAVAVDSSDTLHVVWDDTTYGSGLPKVVHKTRTFAGTWSSIDVLPLPSATPPNTVFGSRFPKITVNSNNEPNVFYTANTNGFLDSIYQLKKTSGSWTSPQLISTNVSGTTMQDVQWVDAKEDDAGNIHVAYWSFSQGIFYRKLTNDTFSSPVLIESTPGLESIKLSATPQGQVFVGWYKNTDKSVNVRWTQGGVWQNAQALTTTSQRSYWGYPIMGITTDSQERAHVGWGEKDSGDNLIDLKYRSFVTGTWQAVQDVDLDNNDADTPFVYPDLWDNQHFSWVEKNPSTGIWELMYRVNEGTISTIPTTGGTVTANPFNINQATLTVPNGALNTATQIGIQVGPLPETISPTQVTIPKAYTFRPHGLVFNTSATVRVFYTDAEAAGADESLLQPWVWDSQTSSWVAQTVTSRSTAQNRMDISLNHFSLYGISAPKVVVDWQKPEADFKGGSIKYSFTLGYADQTPFRNLTPEDILQVNLKDSEGNIRSTDKPKLDKKTGLWSGKSSVKGKSEGTYSLDMLLNGSVMGTKSVNAK